MRRHTVSQSPPLLVNTPEALDEMCYRLQIAPAVAVDTESNSLFAYSERVCLIQFSVPGEDYLVDPLALDDLACLAPIFDAREIEKVFHAAEYDVMVLNRDYGYTFSNLFDTMVASRIVGWPRYGLASLLETHFGVRTNKRMQRTNWGRRPLSEDQIEYARIDTYYLLSLRDRLVEELGAQGRKREARAAFSRVARSRWTKRAFDPDGFWRIKGARGLGDQGLAVLRELYLYRDDRAQELDRPPFKVLNDSVLVALSQRTPRSFAELGRIKGMPRRLPSRLRRKLLDVIEQGLRAPVPKRPRYRGPGRPDEEAEARYEALRSWRRDRAKERGVEPDVILSNRVLHALADENPTSPQALARIGEFNAWERERYGREIIGLLRRHGRIRDY
jgi:ribonuclease D